MIGYVIAFYKSDVYKRKAMDLIITTRNVIITCTVYTVVNVYWIQTNMSSTLCIATMILTLCKYLILASHSRLGLKCFMWKLTPCFYGTSQLKLICRIFVDFFQRFIQNHSYFHVQCSGHE